MQWDNNETAAVSTTRYDWKRYWCPREGVLRFDDRGYPVFPTLPWAHSDAIPFEEIEHVGCLVLLGEPGIGKTTALEEHYERVTQRMAVEGGCTLRVNLNQHNSDIKLIQDIFEHPNFLSWLEQKHPLHLFLDSLDECKLRMSNVAQILEAELSKIPSLDNLYFRIACRSADWPSSLELGLKQLWGKDACLVCELVPLCRSDIAVAAQAKGIDPNQFLAAIERANAVSLAIKPVTLKFLLNRFQRDGQISASQTELYYEGCRTLCEETNPSRRGSGLLGDFSANEKLQAAAQIAVVMILSNRSAIWAGVDEGNVPETDLTVYELSSQRDDGTGLREPLIRETLATGLFSLRGPSQRGWAHQTYAEFLAAWCINEREMPLAQIMGLLAHPYDPEGRLVPQLHETAAWLAAFRADVFQEIMYSDPEVLLKSDMASATPDMRKALVDGILGLYDERKRVDQGRNYRFYQRLDHPDLANQLRRYICDRNKNLYVRRAAIDIAEACEAKGVQDDLVGIALDVSERFLRRDAANAIVRFGDSETKARLKPLTIGQVGEDPDDELKGYGLLAVWPDHISTQELFAALTPPKNEFPSGPYTEFLISDFVDAIPIDELPIALAWVESQPGMSTSSSDFKQVISAIMQKAWNNADNPVICEAFARASVSRLLKYDVITEERRPWYGSQEIASEGSFKYSLFNEHDKRRGVLASALHLVSDPQKDVFWFAHSETPLCTSDDFDWLLECYQSADSEELQRSLLCLAEYVFTPWKPEHVQTVLSVCDTIPELCHRLERSLSATTASQVERQRESEEREQQRVQQITSLELRIDQLLTQAIDGNSDAWWHLYLHLFRDPRISGFPTVNNVDITSTPSWENATIGLRDRLASAAQHYISNYELDSQECLREYVDEHILYYPIYAGIGALYLLLREKPEFLDDVDNAVWSKWAPFVAVYNISSSKGSYETFQQLVGICYQHAPNQMLDALLLVIDLESRTAGEVVMMHRFRNCWDAQFTDVLLRKAADETLQPSSMRKILRALFEHDVADARPIAVSVISLSLEDDATRLRAIAAAQTLIRYVDETSWTAIWPALQADGDFADKVISGVADRFEPPGLNLTDCLGEEQIAEFYIWLAHRYPHAEDPRVQGVHAVTLREEIGDWRDSILHALQRKGTPAAVEAIRCIAQEFADIDWMPQILANAQETARRQLWVPPQPNEILALLYSREGRLVQNGNQLLDVLVDSLQRLEVKLQAETPAAIFLWNSWGKDREKEYSYRPKTENEFSDFVKLHLEEDLSRRGVMLGRKVEIRRGTGGAPGERTDILVKASAQSRYSDDLETVTVIIETKGNWNKKLKTDMQEQLVNRYLAENTCKYGLYLVGWFNCEQWDNKDGRAQSARQFSAKEETQQYLDIKAKELSQQGIEIRVLVINASLR